MKDWELSDQFRQIFAADAVKFPPYVAGNPPTGINLVTAQSGAVYNTPCIIFSVTGRPLDAVGRVLSYRMTISIESDPRVSPDTAAADHAARVAAVQAKLFGETAAGLAAAKVAITNAMANQGVFTLRNYDSPPDNSEPAVEPHRFRTVIPIAGVALLAGSV